MKRKFKLEKETKGTFRYKEVETKGTPIMCGTLYIKKEVLPSPPPKEYEVTLDVITG